MTTRALSIDERKAAEAAFQGKALDPDWTIAAQQVYAGIIAALSRRRTVITYEDVATAV